jgi:GNAT superfamily N-acetyltransferase
VARLSRFLRDPVAAGDLRSHLAAADRDRRPDPRSGSRLGGASAPLVGIAHYLFHPHGWTAKEVCYLQDLFVDAACRRGGIGRRLIEAVAGAAREHGCCRFYWTTKEDNAAARSLYDRIARFNGFIRYDYPLE